ncbi:hypothetical protein [Actinomadura sp. WAC 06369]|uniref:hypothetical protein n=1 Tax=Actinomadura sp. WAC 06369 TaxID=2203193 RepID=UPI000F78E6B3|nr:hypothetical protein [Actinomadura sp. WAC 06369]
MALLDGLRRRMAKRSGAGSRAERRVPTFREMDARMRTERAEARLMATEARIHHEAELFRRGGRRRTG